MQKSLLAKSVSILAGLACAIAANAQFVAFNDHDPGPGTAPNTTTYTGDPAAGTSSGALKNITTGATLPVTLTVTVAGNVTFEGTQGNPSPGTPAYNTFNGFVDFQGLPNPSIALNGAGATYTHTFTGLDPAKRYSLKGTAVRAGGYLDRWTTFELVGAQSFTSAHSANALTTAQVPALTATQVAIDCGLNDTPGTGDMADWENIDPGSDGTFSVVSSQYQGTVPGGSSGGAKGYAMTGLRLEEIVVAPVPATITNQPQSVTTGELQPATFSVGARGFPLPTYQWYKGTSPIPDATNSTYTLAAAPLSDNGALFKVIAQNVTGSTTNTATSDSVTLTVNADHTAPVLVRALSVSEVSVLVAFSEFVSEATATNISNYSITGPSGALGISSAALQPNGSNVVLNTSLQGANITYTLTVNGIRDQSVAANLIAANSTFTFNTAAGLTGVDVGTPGISGSITTVGNNGFDIAGSGADIGGTSDQFTYAYQQRTQDFDVRVRVQNLSLADVWSKAGLMVRQNTNANSTFAAALTTPSTAGSFFESRASLGAAAAITGNAPINYPSTWLRLRRTGNSFVGYASFDGSSWLQLGSVTITMVDPVYVGVVVSSHTNASTAVAQFREYGTAPAGTTVTALTSPVEPPGPSSRKCGLAITEIMYKPAPRTDNLNLEFVEIYNSNPFFEDISGYRLSGEIDYTFPPNTVLSGGAYLVVAKSPGDIQSVYGVTALGPYSGSLGSSGTLRLRNDQGAIYLEIPYSNQNPWPVAADGTGHSLVLARPSYGEGFPQAWAASDSFGGSPGRFDGYTSEPIRSVLINEFLANSSAVGAEFIELYNHANTAVDLSGAYLSDDPNTNKFRIPDGTSIAARGFISFTESQVGFHLDAEGETIYLVNSNKTRVVDAVAFEPQSKDISFGRVPDGASAFYALKTNTPGARNSAIIIGDIVINELMYNPISEDSNDEYIELYNKGTNPVDLSGWQFTAGVNFTFPSNTTIAADSYVVIAKNQTNLFAHYPNLNSGNTFGDYGGTLKNGGERVALARPELHVKTNSLGDFVTNTLMVVADEVTYSSGGRWGNWAAGGGSSLELMDPHSNHRMPSNWGDSDETGKSTWTTIEGIGTLDNGAVQGGGIDRIEILMLGEGECLVDNVEVLNATGVNQLAPNDSTFQAGIGNWVPQGDHVRSTLESTEGYNSSQSLHVRASARGDTGANRVRCALTNAMTAGTTGTIRAKVRWLRGWPEMVIRLKGNYLEATGRFNVPANLGTPGARNSRAVSNAGPAIYQVSHSPVVPTANTPVVVTARADDPDGIASIVLKYRLDPAASYSTTNMVDDGTAGDAVAGDGIYSATIPGQASGALVAFYIQATDLAGPAAMTLFPSNASPQGFECLVRFGDPMPNISYAVYRFWMTQNNVNTWINRPSLSNERVEGTFVYNNTRAIYNMAGKYAGSPYHQGFSSPAAVSCHYSLEFPLDDLLLGTENFNKIHAPGNGAWDDTTGQREQASYWLVRQMGLPWNYRRYVNFVFNGTRTERLMEDSQTPGSDVVSEYFENDSNGNLYKLQPWFEFDDVAVTGSTGAGFVNESWCVMNQFLTTGGVKKLARYRHNYLARSVKGSANDYTDVFALVDTVSTPNTNATVFAQAVESIIDIEEWLGIFAVEHCVGNWDSFGNRNAQNMYGYKPTQGKWRLMIWDYNIVLGNSGSDGPGLQLFQYQTADNNMNKFYTTPVYRRMYWRALKRLAKGPMVSPQLTALLDEKMRSFQASSLTAISSPQPIKDFLSQAAPSILSQLANEDPGTFTVNGNANITVSNNLVTLTGTAPVDAKTIKVNGVEYPITWNGVAAWTLTAPVQSGNNTLVFQGYDLSGNPLPGFTTSVAVTYNGPVVQPQDALVINEIMYHPAVSNASYVEIYNSSPSFAFDLSNWRLSGVDYTFPEGTVITNKQFIVIAKNRAVFASTYGSSIPVLGEFNGNLDPDGEKLSLIKPGTTPDQDQVIDAVRYEASAPWPPAANGGGAALQLIDASEDNSRVSNWSDGSGWRYFSANGILTGSNSFSITLDSIAGDFYIDDITLVTGPAAGAGPNLLQNGGFESGALGPWTVTGNHSGSTVTSAVKFSGNWSLHVIGTAAGSVPGSAVLQSLPNLSTTSTNYTLSFWYLPGASGSGFNYRIASAFRSITPLNLRSSPATPGAANSTAAPLEAFPLVWINEIQPNNVSGIVDGFGQHDPWIELYNSGSNPITLDGYALANTYSNLALWPFPNGTVINPGEFKVIFADGQPGQTLPNELHTNFRLDPTNDAVVLSKNGRILDYINYSDIDANFSYGSYPDAQVLDRQRFFYNTPGAPNNGSPVPVIINEWLASNTNNLIDPATGKYEDWIELYNFGPVGIDLSGFYLTDDLTKKKQWAFPAGTIIGPGVYLLVWADNAATNSTPTDLHANFQLSRNGEQIGLFTPDGLTVDAVTFGPQQNNISQGRYPDGNFAGVLHFMTTPTPHGANVIPVNQYVPILPSIGDRAVNEGSLLSFTALATDADAPAQTLTYTMDPGTPAGATLDRFSGLFRWTPTEVQGGQTYNFTIRVSDNGSPAYTDSKSFNVRVDKVNSPPVVQPINSRTLPENTSVSFTVTASDSDLPAQTLLFSLDPGAPNGASIDPVTGLFSWTPDESQGPSTNNIVVRVTDNGIPKASATQVALIIVTEVNTGPVLVNPGTITFDEGKLNSFTLTATDADLPANRLSFGTVAPFVSGVTINSASGTLNWTPNELAGPSNYVVTIRVFDNGIPSLSATQSFTINVNEVNVAPVMNNLSNTVWTINELTSITLTNKATDADLPTNILSFAIVSAPTGATVDPVTGIFNWTPSEAQGPSSNSILVRVFDNGIPSLSATQRFTIMVNEVNSAPILSPIQNKTVTAGQLLTVNSVVNDSDLPAQTLTFTLVGAGAPTGANLNSSSGVFTWTPSNAQSPSTNVVSIRVADNGTPSLSATQSFTVFVTSAIHITSIQKVDATHLSITCETQSGKNYQVEYSDDLTTPMVWHALPSSQVTAAGSTQVFPITIDSTPHRFYHIAQTN